MNGKKLAVFSIRDGKNGAAAVWVRAGSAWANKDGSLNVFLDVLPLDGRLHVREAAERGEAPEVKPLGQLLDEEEKRAQLQNALSEAERVRAAAPEMLRVLKAVRAELVKGRAGLGDRVRALGLQIAEAILAAEGKL